MSAHWIAYSLLAWPVAASAATGAPDTAAIGRWYKHAADDAQHVACSDLSDVFCALDGTCWDEKSPHHRYRTFLQFNQAWPYVMVSLVLVLRLSA